MQGRTELSLAAIYVELDLVAEAGFDIADLAKLVDQHGRRLDAGQVVGLEQQGFGLRQLPRASLGTGVGRRKQGKPYA